MKQILLILSAAISINALQAQQTVGLFSRTTESEDGYILFPSLYNTETYLIDKCGKKVRSWTSALRPAMSAYLLADGSLLRPAVVNNTHFTEAGNGGSIELYNWQGQRIWSYQLSSTTECQHHDVCPLPNGHILAIVWEAKTEMQVLENGRRASSNHDEVWPDKIVELEPQGLNGAKIVWEWHTWDHLVQDVDAAKPNFGTVNAHPELIDINYTAGLLKKDWMHTNSISYNPLLDQIVLSVHEFNEFWIVDHSTTIAEAAGHTGGRSQHGGDILYQWGNPETYGQGIPTDHHFYGLHDVQWIPAGKPNAGKILVFNNGVARPEGSFSSVEMITPPVDATGNYTPPNGSAYLPLTADWIYTDSVRTDFFSAVISGVQRLNNGNTLITEGTKGNMFEVTPMGKTVWKYINPVGQTSIAKQGNAPVGNFVFKARQYSPSYAGFAGHTLTPGVPIELSPLNYDCNMIQIVGVGKIPGAQSIASIVNPFDKVVTLTSQSELKGAQVTLYDAIGRVCGSWTVTNTAGSPSTLEIAGTLCPGFYTLQIINGNSVTKHRLTHL